MSLVYNNKYAIVGSTVQPDHSTTRYWADLSEEGNGGVLKYWNGSEWTKLNGGADTESDIADLETALAALQTTVEINTTSISTTNSTVSSLSTSVSTNASDISDLEETVETLQTALNSYEAYELPVATETTLGGITVGYSSDYGIKLPVQLDGTDAYVEIPNAEALFSYGVQKETGSLSATLTRIGNSDLHRTLPIQSGMRGCTLADDGTVNHYFNDDWTANEDGTDIALDGTDGMVMIEIPEFYYKISQEDGYDTYSISEYALSGFTHMKKQYISAYEATTDTSDSSNVKLASVASTATEYRGGSNSSTYDDTFRTMLGKPRTNVSRANFRTYARNRNGDYNWNMYDYTAHFTIWLLYTIEYASFNCQLEVTDLDEDGLHQGGLGDGVTNFSSSTWSSYWSNYPIIPCGTSDSLGNNSGEVEYTVTTEYTDDDDNTVTTESIVEVPRYRGIENPFGHIWKNCDGVIFDVYTDDDGGTSLAYICTDQTAYADSLNDSYEYIGDIPRSAGYISDVILGSFIPSEASGASSTTGHCDYFWTSTSSSSLRTCFLGAYANYGSYAGLGAVLSLSGVSDSGAFRGSRLVYREADTESTESEE